MPFWQQQLLCLGLTAFFGMALYDAVVKKRAGYFLMAAEWPKQPFGYIFNLVMIVVFGAIAVACIFVPSDTLTAFTTHFLMQVLSRNS